MIIAATSQQTLTPTTVSKLSQPQVQAQLSIAPYSSLVIIDNVFQHQLEFVASASKAVARTDQAPRRRLFSRLVISSAAIVYPRLRFRCLVASLQRRLTMVAIGRRPIALTTKFLLSGLVDDTNILEWEVIIMGYVLVVARSRRPSAD